MTDKRSLLVLVDGVPTVVAYRGNPVLSEIVTRALEQSNPGQSTKGWTLRTPYQWSPQDLSLRLDQLNLPEEAQVYLDPPDAAIHPVRTTPPVNRAEQGRLWDESGLEWTTKYLPWATEKQVGSFVRRDAPVGFIDDEGRVSWLEPDMAKRFWAKAQGYFEVPGVSGSRLTHPGVRWGANIWKRGKQRRLVFLMFT